MTAQINCVNPRNSGQRTKNEKRKWEIFITNKQQQTKMRQHLFTLLFIIKRSIRKRVQKENERTRKKTEKVKQTFC